MKNKLETWEEDNCDIDNTDTNTPWYAHCRSLWFWLLLFQHCWTAVAYCVHRNSARQRHCQTLIWCTSRCRRTGSCGCFSATRTSVNFWRTIGSHWWTPLKNLILSGFPRRSKILSEFFSFKSCPMVLVKKAGTGLKHFPAFWTCFGSCFIFLSFFPWITLILSSIRLGVKPCFAVCSHSGLQTDQVLINFCGFLFFSHFCTGGLSKFNLRQCLYFILLLSL